MNEILQWLAKNKNWLLSGIGVVFILGVWKCLVNLFKRVTSMLKKRKSKNLSKKAKQILSQIATSEKRQLFLLKDGYAFQIDDKIVEEAKGHQEKLYLLAIVDELKRSKCIKSIGAQDAAFEITPDGYTQVKK